MTKIMNPTLTQICTFTRFTPGMAIDALNWLALKSKDKFIVLAALGVNKALGNTV
jgi:hypothetical protein